MIKPKKNLEEENIFLRQQLAKLKKRKEVEREDELLKLLDQSRQKLIESQELYRDLVANARTIITRMDREGRFTFVNEYGLNFFGYKESELIGKYAHDTIVPKIESTGRDLGQMLDALLKDPDKFSVNLNENIKKNGERVWIEWHNKALLNENHEHIGHIAIGIDITENKRNKDALIESEARFRTIAGRLSLALENGKIGMLDWNRDSNEIIFDERASRIHDLSTVGSKITPDEFFEHIHEEDIQHLKEAIRKALSRREPLDIIYRTRTGNYISVRSMVLTDKAGMYEGLSGVCFDVTEMKKGMEQALIKLNEELLRSNNDLQQFAYVASHDLQEPLRMVASFTQLLQLQYSQKLDRTANEYIKYAVDGSKRMYELLNGLLTFSRVQSRGQQFENVNMELVLQKVKDNLRLKINETNAIIKGDRLPVIVADENQMIQLLQNLIENAIKFSKGDPHISVTSVNRKGRHFIKVIDDGIGIEPQYFEKIFRIFQRLYSPGEYKGTGIGLAICKKIVERHGGEIWVKSKRAEGSTFIFTIPASHSEKVKPMT